MVSSRETINIPEILSGVHSFSEKTIQNMPLDLFNIYPRIIPETTLET